MLRFKQFLKEDKTIASPRPKINLELHKTLIAKGFKHFGGSEYRKGFHSVYLHKDSWVHKHANGSSINGKGLESLTSQLGSIQEDAQPQDQSVMRRRMGNLTKLANPTNTVAYDNRRGEELNPISKDVLNKGLG